MVTILKFNKSKIDHVIYIKEFSKKIVYYLTVCTDDVLDNKKSIPEFTELTQVFEKCFEIKIQEVSVLKYLNFIIV